MQLIEQGKLFLDDPAEKYVPHLSKLKLLTGYDSGTSYLV
jgi:methyl acetate hydrolase